MNEELRDFYEMSLVEIRDYRGLSRRQLSQMIGKNVSEDTLYSIEKRKQVPRVDTAIAICKALGISLKQFCYSIGLDVSSLADDCLPSKDTYSTSHCHAEGSHRGTNTQHPLPNSQ